MAEEKKNRIVIAAAGSGKTTRLVDEALARPHARILITTYTEANEAEIKKKFYEKAGSVPPHVVVQTWFSFLLQHGARPYQGNFSEKRIQGVHLVPGTSAQYANENDPRHYLNNNHQLYTDKLSKFVLKCNAASDGKVSGRLSGIFDEIFIDEIQDLAGYDLELLDMLMDSPMKVLMVGDPRQGTYSTNNSPKYKKYKKSGIVAYFRGLQKSRGDVLIDTESLLKSHRCNEPICALSNSLFPEYAAAQYGNTEITGHDGVFLIERIHLQAYLRIHAPVTQLRDSKKVAVVDGVDVLNFGVSKGLTFNRVLIYPTKPYLAWLKDHASDLAPTSRSKFYVGLTRAKYSVGIVVDNKATIEGISLWLPSGP